MTFRKQLYQLTSPIAATICCAFLFSTAALAQIPSYPAQSDPTPQVKLKKLARQRSDGWKPEGFTPTFSDVKGAFCTDADGRSFYLARYPETDQVTAVVATSEVEGYAVANGSATFRSPDGLYHASGQYINGEPSGSWTDNRSASCLICQLYLNCCEINCLIATMVSMLRLLNGE